MGCLGWLGVPKVDLVVPQVDVVPLGWAQGACRGMWGSHRWTSDTQGRCGVDIEVPEAVVGPLGRIHGSHR